MNAAWAFPFIFVAGMLQAAGAAMGGELNKSLGNPWLATSASFMLVLFVTATLFACMPRPLPSVGDLAAMPWWAPLGGIVGAVAVVRWAARKGAPEGSWLARMLARKPKMLVAVALANRMARTAWALLRKSEDYRDPAMTAA